MALVGEEEFMSALFLAYGEESERTIEEGRHALSTDGVIYVSRSAPALASIYKFLCEALADSSFDWLKLMRPFDSESVIGFSECELGEYSDPVGSARSFVIENVFEVLFPHDAGRFKQSPGSSRARDQV
jgi:hypothetical protein